eukprot:PhF_6_TR4501/c0_g1_i2/m.6251
MGAKASASAARKTPTRYVAKPVFRDPKELEAEYTRSIKTLKSINETKERETSMGPQPWVDNRGQENFMANAGNARSAPKWWINTWMELMDNMKEDHIIVTGQLPPSWDRDKYEPYSLVRNRIDTEDLRWVLEDGKHLPVDELVGHTKLDRNALQNILDTVEMPREQYRNYKGKISRSIDDVNQHVTARKEQIKKAREMELLRRIGYTDEEMKKEDQYITNRTRGMAFLDDIGASVKEKHRRERKLEHQKQVEDMHRERMKLIEKGEYVPTSSEINMRPKLFHERVRFNRSLERPMPGYERYERDAGRDPEWEAQLEEWANTRRQYQPIPSTIHGVPIYFGKTTHTGDSSETVREAQSPMEAWNKFKEESTTGGKQENTVKSGSNAGPNSDRFNDQPPPPSSDKKK